MKRVTWLFALILCGLMVVPVLAEEAAEGQHGDAPQKEHRKDKGDEPRKETADKDKKEPAFRGEYGVMVAELGLSDEQKEKLAAIGKEYGEKQKALATEQKQAREQWREQMKAAREAGDKDKIKQLEAQHKEMQKKHQTLREQRQQAVMAILTPEQLVRWQDFHVFRMTAGSLRRVDLTEEQKKALRDLCQGAGKAWAEAPDEAAKRNVITDIRKKAVDEILTAEQKQKLEAPREKRDGEKGDKERAEKKQHERKKEHDRDRKVDGDKGDGGDDVEKPEPVDGGDEK